MMQLPMDGWMDKSQERKKKSLIHNVCESREKKPAKITNSFKYHI